jgi:hypothetical protein
VNPRVGARRNRLVSQLISIHKGILLQKKEIVPKDRMDLLEDLLIESLQLGADTTVTNQSESAENE